MAKVTTTNERSTPARNSVSSLQTTFTHVVTIRAGTAEVILHKDLICFHSEYFVTAFNGPFEETVKQEITMMDVDENMLHHLSHWLYHQSLRGTNDDGSRVDIPSLNRIYVFAEQKKVPKLKNAVVTEYVQQIRDGPTTPVPDDIAYAYSNTLVASPLRRLTVDNFIGSVVDFKACFDELDPGSFPLSFLADVASAMQRHYDLPPKHATARRGRTWIKSCDYHEHADGNKCAT